MEYEPKVFQSNITRVAFEQKNNLYDLLNITPATPKPVETREDEICVLFKPSCDKYYAPKKKSRLKVRTVREIRNLFEQENYSLIVEDMENQQSSLLTKIRTSSATDDSVKEMAKKMLTADHPISRTAWQMLNNINPDKNVNPTQFVLWNGRRIRVVGSKGGRSKFICNNNLGKVNMEEIKKQNNLEKHVKKKHGLLRDSLNIKFKPGPLRRKYKLDDSHQKYHMGPVELVKLPKPALDIQPAYGTVVEPIMFSFLDKLRSEDGVITEKWAEFAVSVLGTVQNNSIIQVDEECRVTFGLKYKCGQDRILMRRNIGKVSTSCDVVASPKYTLQTESDNVFEVQEMVNKMLDSVEISLMQDSMYSVENDLPETIPGPLHKFDTNNVKDKSKKKFGELDRLAVTVIQIPGEPKQKRQKPCEKSYCSLGCICDSLNYTYKFKQHCGLLECMFGCKCDLFQYKDIELLENNCAELIPGLINLDNEINANLAKEEQKFHQTVVVSGDKSILLKSRKRTSKSTMKYAEFYNSMRLKNENEQETKKILTIVCKKMNCANIEPWCMVHNLFRCFCKGRFTESFKLNTTAPTINITEAPDHCNPCDNNSVQKNDDLRNDPKPRTRQSRESTEKRKSFCLTENNVLRGYSYENPSKSCARINGYSGRKYNDSYYKITNNKILEMEKNDTKLHKKMISIIKNTSMLDPTTPGATPIVLFGNSEDEILTNSSSVKSCHKTKNAKESSIGKSDSETHKNNPDDHNAALRSKFFDITKPDSAENFTILEDEDSQSLFPEPSIPFEISGDIYKPIKGHPITQEFLTPWIANSYKNYKERLDSGKLNLERPKKGRIILHLWECLLSRYRSRKNVFLTTKRRPFRVYIATDTSKPFFNDCINIDDIRFADLHKYPYLVKNLLTNASNKEYFCIMGGWDDCWEIIGSVKKNDVSDDRTSESDLSNPDSLSKDSDSVQEEKLLLKQEHDKTASNSNVDSSATHRREKNELTNNSLERSKWFLMKLEEDFTELYCHKKGFYVEREKILHAIDLARITRKTVVINKQTCKEVTNIPFGIYALPDTTEYCAVVGPYEIDEALGLEIVKSSITIKQKNTKGYWVTTNKVDNIKVLDDPLSFLPSNTVQHEPCTINTANRSYVTDCSEPSTSQEKIKSIRRVQKTTGTNKKTIQQNIPKIVKPIKIRRTNGFYHLTSKNSILKKIPQNYASLLDVKRSGTNLQKQVLTNDPKVLYEETDTCVASGAEQIKITSVYSENNAIQNIKKDEKKIGMFILKPEEINKKVLDSNDLLKTDDEIEMNMDIDNFLNAGGESSDLTDDVLLISDEENDKESYMQKWTDVRIQCSNINNLGWIRARKNEEHLLSIEFPGFKPGNLYSESEAFDKINKVLSTKINIPKNTQIKWKVLTEAKRCPKKSLLNKMAENDQQNPTTPKTTSPMRLLYFDEPENDVINTVRSDLWKGSDLMEDLEKTSRMLEDESDLLWSETENRQSEILRAFSVPEECKLEMSETLQDLMTMNDDLVDD